MHDVVIRSVDGSEVRTARNLSNSNVDFHARYVAERLPTYFDIARVLEPDAEFAERQRLIVGAFLGDEIIGTVAVERQVDLPALELPDDHVFWQRFTEHDLHVYCALNDSLCKTYIGAPQDSLAIHSLAVRSDCRQRGIARSLLEYAIGELEHDERISLYIEFARIKWLCRFGDSLGFETVRRTFSISERLEYGCWGSVLMRYARSDCG